MIGREVKKILYI